MARRLRAFLSAALFGASAAQGTSGGRQVSVFDELHQNEMFIKTPDGQLLYLTTLGEGPPVLVIAGGPGMNYEYLVDGFVSLARTHKVIFLEQRGNILSPAPPEKVSFGASLDDIEYTRKRLSLGKLTLVAHSTGTRTAMGYFSKYPGDVAKLILIGAFPPFADQEWKDPGMGQKLSSRPEVTQLLNRLKLNLTEDLRLGKLKREDVTPRMESDHWRIKLAAGSLYHLDRWRRMQGGRIYYNEETSAAIARSTPVQYDIRQPLSAHPVPIFVLQGDVDYVDPSASAWQAAREQYGLLRCWSRVNVIKQAGHDPWIDAPATFDAMLLQAVSAPAISQEQKPVMHRKLP